MSLAKRIAAWWDEPGYVRWHLPLGGADRRMLDVDDVLRAAYKALRYAYNASPS